MVIYNEKLKLFSLLKPPDQSKPNFMPQEGRIKDCINGSGHMTKMATMPTYLIGPMVSKEKNVFRREPSKLSIDLISLALFHWTNYGSYVN